MGFARPAPALPGRPLSPPRPPLLKGIPFSYEACHRGVTYEPASIAVPAPSLQSHPSTARSPSAPIPSCSVQAPAQPPCASGCSPPPGSAHPTLTTSPRYYFLHPSKQLRPLLVLPTARATNGLGRDWGGSIGLRSVRGQGGRTDELDRRSRDRTFSTTGPQHAGHTASFPLSSFSCPRARVQPASPPPPSSAAGAQELASSVQLLPTQTRSRRSWR